MYLKIETEADIAEFEKYIDVSDLTVDFLIEKFNYKDVVYGSGHWQRTEKVYTFDDMLFYKAINEKTFGEYKIRAHVHREGGYYNNTSVAPSHYTLGYSNGEFSFNLEKKLVVYGHLRKNNERAIEVMKEDGKRYLRIKWNEIYSEIIRINKRNNKTKHKEQVKELGIKWKMQNLLGKLEQEGITIFTVCSYSDTLSSKSVFGENYRISLLKKDQGTTIEIGDDDLFVCRLFGRELELPYKKIVMYSKALQTFIESVDKKDPVLPEDVIDNEEEEVVE